MRGGSGEQLVVPLDGLGRMKRLNSGANGVIYRLTQLSLPNAPPDLVYKEFRTTGTNVPHISWGGLLRIVRVRSRMEERQRRLLDQMSAWPLGVVEDGNEGRVAGVIMPLIPGRFFEDMRLPSGKEERNPREVQHLMVDLRRPKKIGVQVPPLDDALQTRLRLCERFALFITLLHNSDVVYGDISARNTLYALDPQPGVMFVDCDAVRIAGSAAVVKQQDTPDWDPPEAQAARTARPPRPAPLSKTTDRYKLALFILRVLSPGTGASVNRNPAAAARALDPAGQRLLRRALEGQPDERPEAKEWRAHLASRLRTGNLKPMHQRPATAASLRRAVTPTERGDRDAGHKGWTRGPDGRWRPR
jgi:DNA-binding helix-hairpin-helix protein with protein kinase domain